MGTDQNSKEPGISQEASPPGILFRPATLQDVPGIYSLWRQFWPPQPYEVNLAKKIELDSDLVWLAESGTRIVETILGGFDGWWAWIYRVCVDRDYQRKGIAKRLFSIMHERLKGRGADATCLIADPGNVAMASLLKRIGYTEKEDRRYSFRFE